MQSTFKGQRVWISILPPRGEFEAPRTAGTTQPIALVPGIPDDIAKVRAGIVVDANITTLTVFGRTIYRAVEVLSVHRVPGRPEYTKHQAQGILGLSERDTYAPAIDGPQDIPLDNEWYQVLLARAEASNESIVAKPTSAVLAAAIAEFGARPAAPATKKEAKAPAQLTA